MAQAAFSAFEPMVTVTDLDARKDLVFDPAIMADGRKRLRTAGEDYAFRVFRFNPNERLTLVFIAGIDHCRRIDEAGKDDTVNKLLQNIKQRYCGFNPELHNVIALFVSDGTKKPTELAFDDEEQNLIERGLFSIDFICSPPPGGIQEKVLASLLTGGLKDMLNGKIDFNALGLLPKSVLSYLAEHKECIPRLIESRSDS